jgi:hypothetical protein
MELNLNTFAVWQRLYGNNSRIVLRFRIVSTVQIEELCACRQVNFVSIGGG